MPDSDLATARQRIEALEFLAGEVYQIVGQLAVRAGIFETPEIAAVLDNLEAAASGRSLPHDELPSLPPQPAA